MSPQALRRRMAHGNVYAADKVDAALGHYFREGNLTALRELALLWLADRVDEGLERYRHQHHIDSTWATRERIVVPVSGGAESTTLMRRAARIASRASAGEWRALSRRPDRRAHRRLTRRAGRGCGRRPSSSAGRSTPSSATTRPRASWTSRGRRTPPRSSSAPAGRVASPRCSGRGSASGWSPARVTSTCTHRHPRLRPRHPARTGRRPHPEPSPPGPRLRVRTPRAGRRGPAALGDPRLARPDHRVDGADGRGRRDRPDRGLLPAILAALVSGVLLNLLFVAPTYVLTIAEPENAFALLLFVVVGVAVAIVVDNAARRDDPGDEGARGGRRAHRARPQPAQLLGRRGRPALVGVRAVQRPRRGGAASRPGRRGRGLGHGAGRRSRRPTWWSRSTTTRSWPWPATGCRPRSAACSRRTPPTPGCMDERRARDRGGERAPPARRDRPDPRTALLAAVSHDLRSPLSAVKVAADSLSADDVTWSEADRARVRRRSSASPPTGSIALVDQPARHEPHPHRVDQRRRRGGLAGPRGPAQPRPAPRSGADPGAGRRGPDGARRTPACSTGSWPTSARTR